MFNGVLGAGDAEPSGSITGVNSLSQVLRQPRTTVKAALNLPRHVNKLFIYYYKARQSFKQV
jgi:hypothetical protein